MPEVAFARHEDEYNIKLTGSVSAGDMVQLADGRAAWLAQDDAGSTGERLNFDPTPRIVRIPKTTGIVILDGGRVYWDHSANAAHYKPVNDRDFYVGRAYKDAASSDNSMFVSLNIDPPYDIDVARDKHITVIVGTQGLNTMGVFRRGGSHKFILSSTNEAQKLDILSADGWLAGASAGNAIVEFCINVIDDGAGTAVDVSIGAANATHATDADSITESVFLHLDANNTNINLESDDGTTEVAATDTTLDYTMGEGIANRVECWMDFRDPADVQIYINGVLALGSTTFDVNAGTGPWRLLCHIEKTAAADTYEFDLEFLRMRKMEINNVA